MNATQAKAQPMSDLRAESRWDRNLAGIQIGLTPFFWRLGIERMGALVFQINIGPLYIALNTGLRS